MKTIYSRTCTVKVGAMDFDKVFLSAETEGESFYDIKKFVDDEIAVAVLAIQESIKRGQIKEAIRWYDAGNGLQYPSVTSINAFHNGFPQYPDGYAQRGTIVHAYMERYILTGEKGRWTLEELKQDFPHLAGEFISVEEAELDILACNAPACILNLEKLGYKFLLSEKRVINHELKIAGTLDTIAELNKKRVLCDFKTAGSYDKDKNLTDYFCQCAAYAANEDVEELHIIPLSPKHVKPKDPIIETDIQKYLQMFKKRRENFKKVYGI